MANYFFLPKGHLFLSVASALIRIKCTSSFLSFPFSVSLPSTDTFCHSKEFSVALVLKKINLKGLELVGKKGGLNSKSGFKSKDDPGLNQSRRVPGAHINPDEGHTVTTCGISR